MNYCERAGLTGVLALERDDRQAEAVYDRGELVGILVDGRDDEDLHAVFGWEEGSFRVEARPRAPSLAFEGNGSEPAAKDESLERMRRRDETGEFLRVVEVELSRIVEERESRRPGSRSDVSAPKQSDRPMPPITGRQRAVNPDATVRVVYLGAYSRGEAPDPGVRHLRTDVTAEMVLPDASPERASHDSHPEGTPMTDSTSPASPSDTVAPRPREGSWLGGLLWVLVVVGLALTSLAILARLPPLE